MKTWIVVTTGMWILGQTAAPVLGLPEWVNSLTQLSAMSALIGMFGWVIIKHLPRERDKDRAHTERIIRRVCTTFDESIALSLAEQREDRERWATEMKSVGEEIGRCRFRNEGV